MSHGNDFWACHPSSQISTVPDADFCKVTGSDRYSDTAALKTSSLIAIFETVLVMCFASLRETTVDIYIEFLDGFRDNENNIWTWHEVSL